MEFDRYSWWRLQRIPGDRPCDNALCDQHSAPEGRTYRRRLAGDGPAGNGPATGYNAEIRHAAPGSEGDRLRDPPEGPQAAKADREGGSEPLSFALSAVRVQLTGRRAGSGGRQGP